MAKYFGNPPPHEGPLLSGMSGRATGIPKTNYISYKTPHIGDDITTNCMWEGILELGQVSAPSRRSDLLIALVL